jgi:hypothetical protein
MKRLLLATLLSVILLGLAATPADGVGALAALFSA